MNDLIDRTALKNLVAEPSMYDINVPDVLALIDEVPTVDAVEVTRCKDCRASEPCITVRDGYLWCNSWDTVVREDGYCYHAERGG